ncbi:hypothetical protein KAR91_60975 [Candidatus Pacearchaeota archaeon]|nr:hypothetical protein [Candidatus Pacearchaeota archaeon]
MTTTYNKTLITDESTDEDSPVTETLMQDIAQSINYALDVSTNAGANSETLDISASDISTADGLYESAWTSIANSASNNFAHGLGHVPVFISIFDDDSATPWDGANALSGAALITGVDATNITVFNGTGATLYVKVYAF